MPNSTKFLDTSGLTLYDQNIKNYIDDTIENEVGPAIDDKADDVVFVGSGSDHSKGLVPDPGATSGSTKFLREDSSWAVPTIDPSAMQTATGAINLNGAPQSDWNQSDSSASDFIKNKPTVPVVAQSISSGDNGYVTGDMVYDVLGDLETFLSNY